MGKYSVGLDIGGTNIRIGLQPKGGSVECFEKIPRGQVLTGTHSADALAGFISRYIERHRGGESPFNIVLGFPATLDVQRRTVIQAPNIPGIDGLSAEELQEKLQIPVYFEKDVNLLLYCDLKDLQIPAEGVAVGIYIGTGIGNAIFMNGIPLPGKNGAAGELGHIPRAGGTKRCGCGNLGCAECYGSGMRLEEIRQEKFPDTPIGELFCRHPDDPAITEFLDNIACTVAAEVNILDPHWLVLGGGVVNMEGFPFDKLVQRVRVHVRKPFPADNLQILSSKDAVENGVRGALQLGWAKK